MPRWSKLSVLIVAPVVVNVLSGCALVVVPVPTGHGTVRSGTMVPETAASSLRVGETRRADVLANLGPPARRFDDLRIDAYGWTDVSWYFPWLFVVAAGGPPGVSGGGFGAEGLMERWQRHILAIRYDFEDRVERVGFRICGGNQTIGECVHAWVEEGSPVVRAPTAGPHAVVNVWDAEGTSMPGVEILIDGEVAAELPPGTWTAIKGRPGIRIVTVRSRDAPRGKSSLSHASACTLGETSFGLRMMADRAYEVEAGTYQHPNQICPSVRWGVRRLADGIEARRRLREVW